MKNELVFTQKVDGSHTNHVNLELPKVNFRVKHSNVSKIGLPYHKYLKVKQELEERVNKSKQEKKQSLVKKVNYLEIYNFTLNKIKEIQST